MDRETLNLLIGLAHELRTPISAIAGHTSLLSMGVHGPVSEAQSEALRRIQHNQQHLLTLISDVEQYAEAASGAVEINAELVSIWPTVTQAAEALRAEADAQGVRLEIEAASLAATAVVSVDPGAMRTVLDLMLEDALAHSSRDTEINVAATHSELLLQVTVRCDGAPVTPANEASMFVPYARDALGRPVYSAGRSLSLPLARALARAMGAELRVLPERTGRTLQLEVPCAANLRSGVG